MPLGPRRTTIFALLFLVSSGMLARAQGLATIRGTITDPSGANVPNAKVTATQVSTGLVRSVNAGSDGNYLIPALSPADYSLTIDARGFRQVTHTGITLLADQALTLNINLELGPAVQIVNVTEAATQVNVSTGTLTQVINETQMIELPLNGRNAAQLALLVAGTANPPSGGGGAVQGNTKQFPSEIAIATNGNQEDQVSYLLDGANYNDEHYSTNLPFPPPDALQEFSVQTAGYSAQYGNNSGGVVNIITKSGTNAVHGDVFEFLRNAALNARNFFNLQQKDQLKRNQFGFTLGGPFDIPKLYSGRNRTFWFFGYQGTRLSDVQAAKQSFVPTAAELNGDFSAYLTAASPDNALRKAATILDPQTRQPFPGNIIPVSRFDRASLGAEKYLPSATGNGLVFYNDPISQPENQTVERFDHYFHSADQISVRGVWDNYTSIGFYDPTNILSLQGPSIITAQNYLIHETHIFRPNMVNDLRVSYWRLKSSRGPQPGSPSVTDFGVQHIWQGAHPNMDSIGVTGFFGFGQNPLAYFTRQGYNWADDFNWVRGRHNIQLGFSAERSHSYIDNQIALNGTFTFTADLTNLAMASWLLGTLQTFGQQGGQPRNFEDTILGFYAQDSYRSSKRLTLNYGLRYEPPLPWNETGGRINYFNPKNFYAGVHSQIFVNAPVGLLFRGDASVPPNIGLYPNYKAGFMPRLGFAYDLFGDGKTALRGSFGMFNDTRQGADQANAIAGPVVPFTSALNLTQPQGPFSNPLLGVTNPFPAPPKPSSTVPFVSPVPVMGVDTSQTNEVVPVSYTWNLTIERQLAPGWLLRLSYVGNHGSHLRELAQLNPSVYVPGSTLSPDQRRVFAGYGAIQISMLDCNSIYGGGQVTLEKRFSQAGFLHGLTLLGNYTYSRALDDLPFNSGVEGTGASVIPFWKPGRHQDDYGPSEFNHTHVATISFNWPLPKLELLNRFTRSIFGNWEVSGIWTGNSGLPLTVLAGVDRSGTSLSADRAVVVGSPKGPGACGSVAPCVNFLTPSSFQLPALGTFGTEGKGSFYGPDLLNLDVGIFKNFILTERLKVQFRTEFFNIFNHANFNPPTTSLSSAGFGSITTANDPRIGQFALKLLF